MSVENVFAPKAKSVSDVNKAKEKDEEKESYWEKQKKEKRAQREVLEEERLMDEIKNPPQAPQPAFQIQGGMKLDIDPQRDAERYRQELKEQQERSGEKIEQLTSSLDKTKDELREAHITTVMKEMSTQFTNALKEMNDRIAAVKSGSDPAVLASQFEVLTQLAGKMGFQKPNPQIGDPHIQLEITKLEMENARSEREFKAKLAQESRQWDLEKIKLEDDRSFKRAQLAQEEKRNELFTKAPQMVGGAIAQGIMANRGGGAGRVAEEATSAPKAPRGKQSHHVEAGLGDSGEIECPSCGESVAIGSTARVAVCASCGEKVSIRRVGEKPLTKEEEE